MRPSGALYPFLCRKGAVQKCDGVINNLLIALRGSDICGVDVCYYVLLKIEWVRIYPTLLVCLFLQYMHF